MSGVSPLFLFARKSRWTRSDRLVLPVTSGHNFWADMRARNLLFTQFLPDDQTSGDVLTVEEWPDVAYVVWQKEICPTTNRLHYQGYIEFVGKKSYKWVQENCEGLESAHFEVRRGSQAEARRYCMKEDSRVDGPWEFGERREQVNSHWVRPDPLRFFV